MTMSAGTRLGPDPRADYIAMELDDLFLVTGLR